MVWIMSARAIQKKQAAHRAKVRAQKRLKRRLKKSNKKQSYRPIVKPIDNVAANTFDKAAFNMLQTATSTPSENKDMRVLTDKTNTGFDRSKWNCK